MGYNCPKALVMSSSILLYIKAAMLSMKTLNKNGINIRKIKRALFRLLAAQRPVTKSRPRKGTLLKQYIKKRWVCQGKLRTKTVINIRKIKRALFRNLVAQRPVTKSRPRKGTLQTKLYQKTAGLSRKIQNYIT